MAQDVRQYGLIGVLMGGYSSERDISLKSGNAVYQALKEEGCGVVALDIQQKEGAIIKNMIRESGIKLAFIALHGKLGEDGKIQAILEDLRIPYTGSGVQASRLALNKALAQNLFKNNGINVPTHVNLSKNDKVSILSNIESLDCFPLVVKPACEGSSIGISIVHDQSQLQPALEQAWALDDEVLVERFIAGREMTVGILDQTPLPVIEIKPKKDFFDFQAKYQPGMTEYIVPAEISDQLNKNIQEEALKAYRVLGCEGFSRVDFMVDSNDVPYVLEINTVPGFTATSLLPKAAKESGISFNQLCLRIVDLAYGKKEKVNYNTSIRR